MPGKHKFTPKPPPQSPRHMEGCGRRPNLKSLIHFLAAVTAVSTLSYCAFLLAGGGNGGREGGQWVMEPGAALILEPSDAEAASLWDSTMEFETAAEDSSSTSNATEHRAWDQIPYILHQTWKSNQIPVRYIPYVKTWASHKPPLAYYYWTDETSLQFVAKHYPRLLAMFKGYKAHLSRADAIRYMLLHHYGGIYADMDMMRLRDLTPLINSSSELCYLSQERYEITRLFWGLDSSVMNAIMISSPGHKFMEFVVNSLPRYAHHSPNVMESTGPFFLQNVYNEFMKSPPCNLSSPLCRCHVADPYDFMPQVDPIRMGPFHIKCFHNSRYLKQNQREACEMLQKIDWRNDLRTIGRKSYTHHGFLHYGFESQRLKFMSMADIRRFRPSMRTFGRDFR